MLQVLHVRRGRLSKAALGQAWEVVVGQLVVGIVLLEVYPPGGTTAPLGEGLH